MLLAAQIVCESVTETVFLVCFMLFVTFYLPLLFVYLRKESIRFLGSVFNMCQTQAVGLWQCFLIQAGASDDEDFFIGSASLQIFT